MCYAACALSTLCKAAILKLSVKRPCAYYSAEQLVHGFFLIGWCLESGILQRDSWDWSQIL